MLFQGPFVQSRTHRFTYFPFKRPAKAQHSVRISLCSCSLPCVCVVYLFNKHSYWIFSILAGCGFTGSIPNEIGYLKDLSFL